MKHESHIKLLETFQTATHICIVLELCPGGDLLSYVRKRRKLSELQAKYIFKQIIQGLQYLEKVNVVHRDIKLDNILPVLKNAITTRCDALRRVDSELRSGCERRTACEASCIRQPYRREFTWEAIANQIKDLIAA